MRSQYNANDNKLSDIFSGIFSVAWYYMCGDNDIIIQTFTFNVHSDTACDLQYLVRILTWLVVKQYSF